MRQLKIVIDNNTSSEFNELFTHLQKNFMSVMPNTVQAFDDSVKYTANKWRSWAAGKTGLDDIPPNEKPSARLVESIKTKDNGELNATVYSNHPEMSKIVDGQSESTFDMKTKYPYGRKSRLSKVKKIPYLIIPFRWGTPNKNDEARAHFANYIPKVFYDTNVKKLSKSKTVFKENPVIEPNARGEMIERASYDWGTRLKNAWHKNAEGMVRMKDEKNRSTYFTFRIISANSPADSWIRKIPKIEPVDIIAALKRDVEPIIEKFIEDGIKKDLQ